MMIYHRPDNIIALHNSTSSKAPVTRARAGFLFFGKLFVPVWRSSLVAVPRTDLLSCCLYLQCHNPSMRSFIATKCIPNTSPTAHLHLRFSLSTPISLQHHRSLYTRSFTSTTKRSDFHFDTHHFVQRLEREGLKREQAEGIMTAMAEVIDEAIRNMTSNMVTKSQQEKVCLLQLSNSSGRPATLPKWC